MKADVRDLDPEFVSETRQDGWLADTLEFESQRGLQNLYDQDARLERERSGMIGNKVPNELSPRCGHRGFIEALEQSESFKLYPGKISESAKCVLLSFDVAETAPLGKDRFAEVWIHSKEKIQKTHQRDW